MERDSEQPTFDERALSAGGGLRLVRLRLRLALLATFMLPFVISTPIFSRLTSPATELFGPTIALIGVALSLGLMVAWLAKKVLEPAARLEEARTFLREAYDEAKEDSLIDPLTKLGNHRAFQEELDRQLATASRYGGSISLVIVDLDSFKKVNDTMGHAAGDKLLHAVAALIVGRIRRSDRAFRTGGDEFGRASCRERVSFLV